MDFSPCHLAQRAPAEFVRQFTQRARAEAGLNGVCEFLVEEKEFVDGNAAAMAFAIALDAAPAFPRFSLGRCDAEGGGHFVANGIGDFTILHRAMLADAPREALRRCCK